MNIVIIGMRRSGTTILYDVLQNDKRFTSFYEPLCHGKKNIGGGSGATSIPYGDLLNKLRAEFISEEGLNVEPSYYNFGAPANPKLEFINTFPDDQKKYLKYIFNKTGIVLTKFVRMNDKIEELYKLIPDAKVIYIKKDPRRFSMSHVIGRKKASRSLKRILFDLLIKGKPIKEPSFFKKVTGYNTWSSENFCKILFPEDFERIPKPAFYETLKLWKYFDDKYTKDGRKFFKENFLEVIHEDLCIDPKSVIDKIYNFIELPVSDQVLSWANDRLKAPRPIYKKNKSLWDSAFLEIGIDKKPWEKYS